MPARAHSAGAGGREEKTLTERGKLSQQGIKPSWEKKKKKALPERSVDYNRRPQ